MKRTTIRINGTPLTEAMTRVRPARSTKGSHWVLHGDVKVWEDDDDLAVTLHPMTLAQLYYDGVLPQDRSVSLEITIDDGAPRLWRIEELVACEQGRGPQLMMLRLASAEEPLTSE